MLHMGKKSNDRKKQLNKKYLNKPINNFSYDDLTQDNVYIACRTYLNELDDTFIGYDENAQNNELYVCKVYRDIHILMSRTDIVGWKNKRVCIVQTRMLKPYY